MNSEQGAENGANVGYAMLAPATSHGVSTSRKANHKATMDMQVLDKKFKCKRARTGLTRIFVFVSLLDGLDLRQDANMGSRDR